MAENTNIPWCDHTFNPWLGCEKVSPACKYCYAELFAERRFKRFGKLWGEGSIRHRTSEDNWKKPLAWNRKCEKKGIQRKVLVGSMCDIMEKRPELELMRKEFWKLVEATPYLDYMLLTKRIENTIKMVPMEWLKEWPANVWLGATAENQQQADKRIPELIKVPARIRFLSCEPLLSEIKILPAHIVKLHWIIAGGESGTDARPMHLSWAKALSDQCKHAGRPFFFKQWGEWKFGTSKSDIKKHKHIIMLSNGKHGDPAKEKWKNKYSKEEWNKLEAHLMARVGKKAAGDLLQGKEYKEFPKHINTSTH